MLRLIDVSRSFNGTVVLQPTTLTVSPGRTTVLIGPSGCGKSTLLRLMVGVLKPDSGSVHFDGKPVTEDNALQVRRQLGFVLQDGGLFPHLSARDNVALLSRCLHWDEHKLNARIAELAQLVRLPESVLDRFPSQLSGGQRQRVGLMRALLVDPPVVLLDEPLGALDPLVRFDLQNDLKAIFQTVAKTVVLVTHDLREAGFFGDWVVLLGGGRIVQQGTLQDLVARPAEPFVQRFLNAQRGAA
jgi:osmoprotectant transport system ATP-binding protein